MQQTAIVRNQPGIHARPAALFVKRAGQFESEIFVALGDLEVNGKSIMGVMMLAAEAGAELRISAAGPDEKQAVDALVELIDTRFGDDV